MKKITTHLWFDTQAKEAAAFYTEAFGGTSKVMTTNVIRDTPSGDVDIVTIEVHDQEFTFISAGPLFKFTPAISLFVACKTKEEVDALWNKLAVGGSPLMDIGAYPFSERYGWTKDKYGLSWQIMYMGDRPVNQKITPTLMFVGDVCGKAEEAIDFYTSIFHDAKKDLVLRYEKGESPAKEDEGLIKHAIFTLEGQKFGAMDSSHKHEFTFNEAISFVVRCDTQKEIDEYWEKLSALPASEQCGWLKDKYGVSWQIVPSRMDEMMATKDEAKLARVTEAFMKMKKFDLAELERAYAGE